jgi:hypothetical protein
MRPGPTKGDESHCPIPKDESRGHPVSRAHEWAPVAPIPVMMISCISTVTFTASMRGACCGSPTTPVGVDVEERLADGLVGERVGAGVEPGGPHVAGEPFEF